MKTTGKNNVLQVFIDSGHIELLRLQPKSSSFVAYLPSSVSRALNLSKDDHSLIAFIDTESNYPYIIITKDTSLLQQLRPLILSKRQMAESLHKKMREQLQKQLKAQLQTQRQQTGTEVAEVMH